jgi:hypothetical protein
VLDIYEYRTTVTCWFPLFRVNMLYYLALQRNRIHPLSHSPLSLVPLPKIIVRTCYSACFLKISFKSFRIFQLMMDHLLRQVLHGVSRSEKYPINNVLCEAMVFIGYSQFINWKKWRKNNMICVFLILVYSVRMIQMWIFAILSYKFINLN